jgi:KipI family sensor histidine kinase inhibitor
VASWLPLGDRAIRFARPVGVPPATLLREAKAWPGAIDVVVAREDVAIYFATEVPAATEIADRIAALGDPALVGDVARGREIELEAVYDGEDLAEVAQITGLTVDEVARIHCETDYTVDVMGFLPGFAYLIGLDPRLHLPRRATPRTRVPAGALAIALDFTAVYPQQTPGGWHLIGRVDEPMWGPDGARLALGDRVRFRGQP